MANRLVEGFSQGIANSVRSFFAHGSAAQAGELMRGGSPSVERAGLPFNLTSQFGYDSLAEYLRIDQGLQARYTDYEEMDEYGEIASALDIYADDSAMPDMQRNQSVWVISDNKGVERDLNEMLHKKILIENDIWGLERTISKYGNAFGELLVSEQGLIGLNFLPPPTMRRVEGPKGQLLGFVQDIRGEFNLSLQDFYKLAQERGQEGERTRRPGELTIFEDWEVVHWRLRGKHLRSVYGHGVVDPARWIWKRLALLEDALLIYKLSRAPARYAFYVDIGEYDNERGLAYVNRVKNQFVKKKFINPNTGKMDMRHNPLAHDEDFFIPSRGGKDSTRIEVLQGPDYAEVDTVEYHRDKLVSALKVPKSYMGYGGEANKGSLSTEDIRFARTVMRVQRETQTGIRQACRVHLIAKGADHERYDYDVRMSVPSTILELSRLEVLSATADLASRIGEVVSTKWVLTELFDYSEQEAEQLMKDKDDDLLRKGKIEAETQKMIAQATAPPEPPAPPPGEGGEEEGGEEGGEEAAAAEQRAHWLRNQDRALMEKRIRGLLERHHRNLEESFDRKMQSTARAEDSVVELIKKYPALAKRLRETRDLLHEVKAAQSSSL